MLAAYGAAKWDVESLCEPISIAPTTYLEGSQLDVSVLSVLNSKMCSFECPCPIEAAETYSGMSESDLGYFLRDDLVFTDEGKTYETFKQCWNEHLIETGLYADVFADKMFDYLEYMEEVETTESCSGLCQPGLFWFTRPASLESPLEGCLDIQDDVD